MKACKLALPGILGAALILQLGVTAKAATNVVNVTGPTSYLFVPSVLTITNGDTVVWTNVSTSTHDVSHGTVAGGLNSTPYWARLNLAAFNGRSSVTFSNVGAFPYVCNQHVFTFPMPPGNPTQTGLVTVVVGNLLPTVGLTAPTNLSRFAAPASFTVSANAADSDGTVTNVQFFAGANLLGEDSTAPYSIDVTGLAAGFYSLTARARDNVGGIGTSPVVNVMVNTNRIVNVAGFTFVPNILSVTLGDTVTFNGLDNFHTVTGTGTREPFCGTAIQSSCTMTFNAVGSFPFHCIPHQLSSMTGMVTVVGPNLRPFVTLTSPANGAVFAAPATFDITADASDYAGFIQQVRFVRGGTTQIALDMSSPYSATANNLAAGNYVLTALATDTTLLVSTSAPVNISVITPTSIQLLSPAVGESGFKFDFTANPGLTYVVEGSAAVGSPIPFVPLATNVANANLMSFTDSDSSNRANRAYRVFRRP